MAEGQYLKLITEQGPARNRLERTLREAQSLSKALGELSIALTGGRYQDAVPKPIETGDRADGLLPKLEHMARQIETELTNMRQLIEHMRRQI